ncbi:MAG: MFS transporter [Alphaproteobacteria bacterium]|nr:MFS transporter [Alphaproteobacteria bacterium]
MTVPYPAAVPTPLRGWLAWATVALFYFYAFVQRTAPSAMIDPLMRDFAVGGAVLGNLLAFYFYAYAGLQLPVGALLDRYGPRRLITFAAALCTGGCALFALAEQLPLAYLGRFLVGVGAGVTFVGALLVATRWLPRERFALFTGLTQLAGALGAWAGQVPGAMLVEDIGWRGTMLVGASISLALVAAVWLLVRDWPPGAAPRGAAAQSWATIAAGLGVLLRRRVMWLAVLYGFCVTGPILAYGGLWGVAYMQQVHGMAREKAAFVMSMMIVGWAIGAPLCGWLQDKLPRRRPLMIGVTAVAALALGAAIYVPGLALPAQMALYVVAGFGATGVTLAFAYLREANAGNLTATAFGILNTGTVGGGAVMQPLVGLLLDLNWDGAMVSGARLYSASAYDTAFAILPCVYAVAAFAAWLLPEPGDAELGGRRDARP